MSQKHTASAWLIIGVATLLGAFSTFQAYQFVRLFSEHTQPLFSLAVMNFSFWYGWALLAPIVLWSRGAFRSSAAYGSARCPSTCSRCSCSSSST